LTVPRGSRPLTLALPDGTKVWVDAGSEITYPAIFSGPERKVSVKGQSYFEVAKNAAKPFVVAKNDMEIRVLGTHFNVNAFDDESNIRVTLLEGKVQVGRTGESALLDPGQQALLPTNGKIKLDSNVDLEVVMAWKNNRFELNGQTIEPIMRQVARWYGVEIEYQGGVPDDNFVGSIPRQENVSVLLKILEQTQAVHFKITDKKIIVMNP
jgi:ferric-dicitrate binding protein FerR (iron transport regulator)